MYLIKMAVTAGPHQTLHAPGTKACLLVLVDRPESEVNATLKQAIADAGWVEPGWLGGKKMSEEELRRAMALQDVDRLLAEARSRGYCLVTFPFDAQSS